MNLSDVLNVELESTGFVIHSKESVANVHIFAKQLKKKVIDHTAVFASEIKNMDSPYKSSEKALNSGMPILFASCSRTIGK